MEARPLAHAAVKKAYREADEKNIPLFKKKLQFIKFTPDELAAFRKAGGDAGVGGMGRQARGPGHPGPRAAELPAQGSRFAEILIAPMPATIEDEGHDLGEGRQEADGDDVGEDERPDAAEDVGTEMSGRTPLTTNTTRPTGGDSVAMPFSLTRMMPNQIGS